MIPQISSRKIVDWLQYSVIGGANPAPRRRPFLKRNDLKPRTRNYEASYEMECEGIVQLNFDYRNRMGTNVLFTGAPMDVVRGANEEENLVKFAYENYKNISRIDMTMDIVFEKSEDWKRPSHYRSEYERGACSTNTECYHWHDSRDNKGFLGETFVIGSEKSEKCLVVYDKGSEQKMKGAMWTRFELRCRDNQAIAACQNISAIGVCRTVTRWISTFAHFHDDAFEAALEGEDRTNEVFKVSRKETKLDEYLENAGTAILKKARQSKENHDKILEWIENLKRNINKE